MIKFDLKCEKGHIFEASFDDSKSFEFQRKKKLIECPYCLSCKITKSIMAPNVSSKSNKNNKINKEKEKVFATYNKQIKKLKSEIEKNFTYVGKKFPEEARKIHYGEVDEKTIYGEATEKESKELLEEGISLIKLPFDKKDKMKKKN
tara:strand:- start:89 stop:529 length:441 start_codon:yes stop_codon:yes gene_type:complete